MSAPATTVANPEWFRAGDVNRPRIERARLHRQLLDDARATVAEAAADRRAVIVTGATPTTRASAVEEALGAATAGYLRIGATQFTDRLLGTLDEDSSPESVADEARSLAERLRDAAVRDGLNIVIDTAFADAEHAVALGSQLATAGYTIHVIEIQADPATAPDQQQEAAHRLAVDVGAVTDYQRFAPSTNGSLRIESNLSRPSPGGPLVDAAVARAHKTAQAGTPIVRTRPDTSPRL